MNVAAIFVLTGQIVQVVAGFILSVEVIGLKRIDRWSRSLSVLHKDVAIDKPQPFFSRGSQIPRIFCALGSVAIGAASLHLIRRWGIDKTSTQFVWLLVFCGVGGLGAAAVWQLLMWTLRGTAKGLRSIHSRSRARTSGILGFVLLLLGFLLEFGGTLVQSLKK